VTVTVDIDGQSWPIPMGGIPLAGTYKDGVLTIDFEVDHSGEYAGYSYDLRLAFHLRGTLESRPEADDGRVPAVELKLNKSNYKTGDRLRLEVGIHNNNVEREVDLYLTFFDPEGNYFFAPEYTSRMLWLKRLHLAPHQEIALSQVLEVGLPAHTPPIVLSGKSHFCAVLTEAGKTMPLSAEAFADFTYNAPDIQIGGPYDGDWIGTGTSAVPGGPCPALATVTMHVTDSQIEGEADEAVEDGDSYRMTGRINEKGEIVDGQLLEDFRNDWIVVGSFKGNVVGNTINGTWIDDYGCYGTFTAEKQIY
jgi:hypothetical protein